MYSSAPVRRPLVLPAVRPITSLMVLMALLASTLAGLAQPGQFLPRTAPAVPARPDLEQLPLAFEPNAGQVDPQVRFQARGLGGMVYFTDREIVMTLPQPADGAAHSETLAVLRLAFDDASRPEVAGADPLPGTVSYFIGDDSTRWRNGIATYAGIVYRELYPGVDLRYDGTGGQLKGTYTVAAGADPASIRWRYTGAETVAVDAATGDLRVTPAGAARGAALTEAAPVAWQEIGARRVPVNARHAVGRDGGVSFVLGAYDRTQPLIIDPTLTFSTALGGSGADEATGVAVDPAGNTYITGYTSSTNFPTGNAVQTMLKGGADTFVTKINPEGTARVYSTYLGGAQIEGYYGGGAIAADQAGNAYITGSTTSSDFPTVGAIQDKIVHDSDFYVVKLSPSGNGLVYSTYLGGSGRDVGAGIAVDYDGNAYVTGGAGRNFPLANPIYAYNGDDAVVAKLNAGGSKLVYSTYLGGSGIDAGQAIAVDWEGSAYVGGFSNTTNSTGFPLANPLQPAPGGNRDGFVSKLNPAGDALVYSTYLGGSGDDWVEGVAVDAAGNVAVMGNTASTNFPTRSAYQGAYGGGTLDAFVTKLNAAGNDFVFSTYLGGRYGENSVSNREGGIAVDPEGGIYVTGWTGSDNFPFRAEGALQPQQLGGDAFVTKFRANGTVIYSTPLGGNGTEYGMGVAVDDAGTAHVVGTTFSPDFPTVAPLQTTLANNSNYDAYVSRIAHGPGRTVMFDPGAVVFGTEPLDVASLPETVYIANVGTAALPLGGVTLIGPPEGDFTLTKNNCASRSLATGVECRIEVRFTPRRSGPRTARIVVESSVWDGPRSIFLRGTGRPNVVVEPAELDFGFQIKDAPTPAQSVTLTNLASSPQAITTPTITGLHKDDFALTTTCGSAIPAAGSCTVEVTFTPKALDGRYARLSVLPQGADQPLVVPLSGFGGTTPSITVSQDDATPVGDIPLVARDKLVRITGRNFNITPTNNKVRVYIGARDLVTLDVGPDRTINGSFTIPVELEGELTVEAEHLGVPADVPVTARFRTPMEDIPVILIPGVSGTKLIAEEGFIYVAPPNPELAIPIPDPSQLLPVPYPYLTGQEIWLNALTLAIASVGQSRAIDALMLNHYGSTPEPDALGNASRKIVTGELLWNVDLGVTQADFYGKLRDHLLSLGYTAAGKAGTGSGSKLLYYFGYDWRKDVYGTGPDLNALVKRAMAESGKTKVNIIAHSMGGWVTRNYLLQYGASDVDQVITLGTPFLGAPKALKVLEHGDEWGMVWHPANNWGGPLGDLGLGLHPKQMKRLAQNFPAAYELLPSKYWFQGRPFSFTADPAYITRSVNNSGTMEYELLGFGESSQFLRQRHNYDLVRTAERFHAQGIGDLSLLTNQYIHHRIAGTGVSTNGRIEFSPRKVCATVIVVVCTDLPEFAFPKMNLLGDGTVPFHSAIGAYAPPDARIYQVPGAEHNPLTSDARSLTLVTELLRGTRTNNLSAGSGMARLANTPAAAMPSAATTPAAEPAAESFIASGVEIAVLGAGNLTITDDQGRVTGHVPGSHYATVGQIPGVTFETGEGAQVAMLPATGTFQVTIRGTPAGGAAQLRMSEVTGGTNTKTLVFEGIPLTAETVATTTASGAGVPESSTLNFKYDASTPEQPVGTLPALTGPASEDISPPISRISMGQAGLVTITGQDEPGGSGLASILYTTDGTTFKPYTAPFRAPSGTRAITAVALDKAGNAESPGARLELGGSRVYLPLVRR